MGVRRIRLRRRDLVEVLAARVSHLDGDLVDLTWQSCAAQDMAWIRDSIEEAGNPRDDGTQHERPHRDS